MPFDLRKTGCSDVLSRVQRCLDVQLDPTTEVRKRRSMGFRTDRGTWVRVEVRSLDRVDGQGWGVESAGFLGGVARPVWLLGLSWLDEDRGVVWRADETEYVADAPVKPGGVLTVDPGLSESWWATFNASLTALAGHTTVRVATPTLQPITQERVSATIGKAFPEVDVTVREWRAAHADLGWANLTAPVCWLLDWEDWGMAPRGWDAATLWTESLAVPALAERVRRERSTDLDTRTGKIALLFHCAELLSAPAGYAGVRLEPAQAAAAELVRELRE